MCEVVHKASRHPVQLLLDELMVVFYLSLEIFVILLIVLILEAMLLEVRVNQLVLFAYFD